MRTMITGRISFKSISVLTAEGNGYGPRPPATRAGIQPGGAYAGQEKKAGREKEGCWKARQERHRKNNKKDRNKKGHEEKDGEKGGEEKGNKGRKEENPKDHEEGRPETGGEAYERNGKKNQRPRVEEARCR
ncbi:MAG: hypothetical protein GF418_03870, partial [Chitinivibrionales bacterium]|nr:hypothetical protein [Chitinivibrionales bacterium]MBD3394743.1 hypothetical protein [Chitinivibrionales bacterium]